MKINLDDILKSRKGAFQKKEMEHDLKICAVILDNIRNGADFDKDQIEFLHQQIESLWYDEKKIRGEW
ncbi:TPA: hypothetical protein KD088_003646 [Vibrio parahaemolyticus]|nr:hypothetical protein [Vibrio parahaemolyticus]